MNDVTINNLPKFLAVDPTDQTHALTIRDQDDLTQTYILQLTLRGVILLLYVRKPSHDEWNKGEFRCLALTLQTLTWDLTDPSYEEQDNAMIDHAGQVVERTVLRGRNATLAINALASSVETVADVTNNNNFYRMFTSHIMISSVDTNLTGHMRTRAQRLLTFGP